MSLKYRINRIDNIVKSWGLNREHNLIASLSLEDEIFENFKCKLKLFISRALNFSFTDDEDQLIKNIDANRNTRLNITPNGAVVPKREFQLEYNLILREWCKIIRTMVGKDKKLLSIFRVTPNIRIKFGKELEDNIGRGLNTSYPHSDAWVEGPWGMNCYVPLFGDTDNNTLVFYEPIEKEFDEKMLGSAESYKDMQWVMKHYNKIKFVPQKGKIYFSDYSMIHNTNRNHNCGSRVSIDTTLYVGDHKPHPDRVSEYRENIPDFGITEFFDPGQYESDAHAEKKSAFSHYTAKVMKTIKIYT